MPLVNQAIRTAIKGLITERQELVFPEDASVDELNCDLLTDGSRKRRRGLVYEDDYELSSFTITAGSFVHEKTWFNVGGVSNLEFLVVQTGSTLRFYDKSSDPVSGNLKSFTINLNSFKANNGVSVTTNPFQCASLDGVLVVTHPGCNAFYVTYNSTADTISTTLITHKIRDFEWQGDVDTYYTSKLGPSVGRKYDTMNAGWVPTGDQDPLSVYRTFNSNHYPPLTHPWYTGKEPAGTDTFNYILFNRNFAGTTLTANGHIILNFFSKDRGAYFPSLGVESESSRFRTVEAYAGRFWYAGLDSEDNGSKILFTKVIEDNNDYGICHQVNDPTAEDFSDLLDSDGGLINIPDAYGISKLYAFGTTLLVFAENGIWQIKGVDDVFKATEYSVSKVSPVGLLSEQTFIDADGTPFWWSRIGIHSLGTSEVSGAPQEVNLSKTTIQEFWNNIDTEKKLETKGTYDVLNKVIYWMFPSNDEATRYKYNRILRLDIPLQAFIPWEISDQDTATNYVVGLSYFNPLGSLSETQDVTVSSTTVTVGGVDVSVSGFFDVSVRSNLLKFLVKDGATDKLTFAAFTGEDLLDWEDTEYSSYFELGAAFFENLSLRKHPMVVTTYFKVTESGFSDNGDGSYSLLTPSACQLKVYWDFKTTPSSTQNVYRLRYMPVVDTSALDEFDYPSDILINRTRIKGRGRAVKLRFESDSTNDFEFLGYELLGFMNESL